jgi:hypothetical protein
MTCLHRRSACVSCLAIGLFSFVVLCSCNTTTKDPKQEFVHSLQGANVQGYLFSSKEDDDKLTVALTNGAVRKLMPLDKAAPNVVLQYTRIKDKRTDATRTYRTEIVGKDSAIVLQVTDLASSEVVSQETFPAPLTGKKSPAVGETFDSLDACLKNFDCTQRPALQCQANSTCKVLRADVDCCLNNGQCFNVLVAVSPTSLRCQIQGYIPNFEGLVFKQQ